MNKCKTMKGLRLISTHIYKNIISENIVMFSLMQMVILNAFPTSDIFM